MPSSISPPSSPSHEVGPLAHINQSCNVIKNNVGTLPKHLRQTLRPLASQLSTMKSVARRSLKVGSEGAAISLVFAGITYPLATIASNQIISGKGAGAIVKDLQRGGIPRFFKGAAPSGLGLVIARFCDAAGDMAATEFLDQKNPHHKNPTTCALLGALVAGALYLPLVPVETFAVTAQTGGAPALKKLGDLVAKQGLAPLYNGAMDSVAETLVDHLMWYGARHFLEQTVPEAKGARDEFLRSCFIGAISSIASDSLSHPVRVVKMQKQVLQSAKPSLAIAKKMIQEHGPGELWRRGFTISATANCFRDSGFQGVMAARGNNLTEKELNQSL